MVVAFTTLFNNISINRETSTNETDSTIKIPVVISEKSKWYRKLNEEIRQEPRSISRLLPRMSVDLIGLRYDSSRSGIQTLQHTNSVPRTLTSSSSSNSDFYLKKRSSYLRIPYTYDFELSIATKSLTDSFMIIEQILPLFKPERSVTINDHRELDISTDVSIVFKDITKESNRFDSFDDSDLITWTLGFEARGYMYSPVADRGVILSSIIDIYDDIDSSSTRVLNITSEVTSETEFDLDDLDTYSTTSTEYETHSPPDATLDENNLLYEQLP